MDLSKRDMTKLAILLNKTVYSVDFPREGKFRNYAQKTLRLVNILEQKYEGAELLCSVREAVEGIAEDKMRFYTVTRGLMREVNSSVRYRNAPSQVTFIPFNEDDFTPLPYTPVFHNLQAVV